MNPRTLPIILAALTAVALCVGAQGTAEAQDDDAKAKPSALEGPPSKETLIVRFSLFPGFSGGSARKDSRDLRGTRLDFRDDLHTDIVGPAAGIALSYRLSDTVWATARGSTVRLAGDLSARRAFSFGGVDVPAGGGLESLLQCHMLDLSAVAFQDNEDSFQLGMGLGFLYAHLDLELSPAGLQRLRDSADAYCPYIAIRSRLVLADTLDFEVSLDLSLFAYVSREVIVNNNDITIYLDPWGNPVAENVNSTDRRRYLVNRYNMFLDFTMGFRWEAAPGFNVRLGYRFFFLNAETEAGGKRKDLELRSNGIELSLSFSF
jgi:hypothetical protein